MIRFYCLITIIIREGFTIDLEDNFEADIFLNIPYAKPPVGELRFEKPQPPESWKGVREAKNFGHGCLPHVQGHWDTVAPYTSEDCLSLNIFRPHKKSKSPEGYPVLVWVHGGGFCTGNAILYGFNNISNNFVRQDLVVITIQYRLGHLGFVSTGDEVMPGNYGLWDLAQAFKFIHENIEDFGGDPKKITAWGLSAGGALVSALSLSPHSRDYIARSIEMSGVVLATWASSDAVITATEELALELSCTNQDSKKVKECFKKKSTQEILDASEKIGKARYDLNLLKWQPRIDGDFFPKDYPELIKEATPKPAVIGFADVESAYFTLLCYTMSLNEICIPKDRWSSYGEQNLTYFIKEIVAPENVFGKDTKEVQKALIEFYVNHNKPQNADYNFYLERYTQIFSDANFNIPGLWTAQQKMEAKWPVYLYLTEHYNKGVLPKDLPVKGAVHAAEYPYIFGLMVLGQHEFDEADKVVHKTLVEAIGSFAKTGNPSTSSLQWPKLSKNHPLRYLDIKGEPEVEEPLMEERLKFWNELTEKYDFDIIRGLYKGTQRTKDEL
uniref:Carboxylesterase type B domain-containing protein n=1 Tax=Acrobeloides nanus TaxID=290746 RepID=A0A914CR43_9BILA